MSCLKSYRVGVVAHNCEPAIWEVEIMRTVVQGQPGQKVIKTPSQQKSWVLWYVPFFSITWALLSRRNVVKSSWGKKCETLFEK
jgi:hypothetical protein